MDATRARCQALTIAGVPCKNAAQPGSIYCAVHLRSTARPPEPPAPPSPAPGAPSPLPASSPSAHSQASMELLLHELEALAREFQRRLASRRQSGPAELLGRLNRSIGRFAPEVPREVLRDLERNLEGTTYQDLVDPETLKGLWYVLTCSVQGSTQDMRARLDQQLAALPGYAEIKDLAANFEGTTPKDLVDPDTWKGFLYIVTYTAQQQLDKAKRRTMGSGPADE